MLNQTNFTQRNQTVTIKYNDLKYDWRNKTGYVYLKLVQIKFIVAFL